MSNVYADFCAMYMLNIYTDLTDIYTMYARYIPWHGKAAVASLSGHSIDKIRIVILRNTDVCTMNTLNVFADVYVIPYPLIFKQSIN